MNFIKMLLVLFAVETTFILFGLSTIPGSEIVNWLQNLQDQWDENTLMALIGTTLGLAAVGGVIVGLIFYKTDFIVFAILASTLFYYGQGLIQLYQRVSTEGSEVLAVVFITPLALLYVFTCIAWWRGRA